MTAGPAARPQDAATPKAELEIAQGYERQSQFTQALPHFERALAGFRMNGDYPAQAQTLRQIAQLHKNTGDYASAIANGQEALDIYTALGEGHEIALTWVVIGATHDSAGDHRSALDSFERALPAFAGEKSHDVVNLLNEIGITLKNLGNYSEALRTYRRGLDLAREISDTSGAVFLALNLAVLDSTIGQTEQAVQEGQDALVLARKASNRRAEALVLENLAVGYWGLGDRERALTAEQEVLVIAQAMGTRNQQGIILKNLGDMHSERGELALARQQYDAALTLQRAIGERQSIGSTLAALADLSLREGQLPDARRAAEEALALARQSERPELEWTARRALAAVAVAQGESAQAIDELRASAGIINNLRANIAGDMSKVAYVDTRQEVFTTLASLLVTANRPDEGLEAAEAGRARAFADLLLQRQIVGNGRDRDALAGVRAAADAWQHELDVAALETPPRRAAADATRGGERLAETMAALAPSHRELESLLTARGPTIRDIRATTARLQATLVEYLVADRELLAWVVAPDGVVHVTKTMVTREHLDAVVAQVRTAVAKAVAAGSSRRTAPPRAALRELGMLLVDPIAAWLPASPDATVVIVPHGPLALAPFAALEDSSGRPLIETHALSSAPSASVFLYTAAHGRPGPQRALVVADPTPPAGSGATTLPWARAEGELVARHLHGAGVRLVTGGAASEATVKREAGNYAVLHFATHGLVVPDRPLASSLLLAADTSDDGYLRVDEIFNLDLSANLVVLSGCATGLGKLTGDGIVGLTRALLYAGARSVVVSEWNVSDRATFTLMDRFYAELERGASTAQALRAAALRTRKTFPNPAFWAAFDVVGEPQ